LAGTIALAATWYQHALPNRKLRRRGGGPGEGGDKGKDCRGDVRTLNNRGLSCWATWRATGGEGAGLRRGEFRSQKRPGEEAGLLNKHHRVGYKAIGSIPTDEKQARCERSRPAAGIQVLQRAN